MKLISWNVNGIRACVKKGAFFDYLEKESPDILCVQETKAHVEAIPEEILNPRGYYAVWHSAERKGYSGVALFTKKKPNLVLEGFGNPKYDCEGRVVSAEYDDFVILGVYFPNGGMGEERVKYKLEFYEDFFNYCNDLKAQGKNLIICGDYNTAHKEIDLARPKENRETSGFMDIEREWIDKIIDEYGYVDTFREFDKSPEIYSWWAYRTFARKRNVGWRIDYFFVNKEFLPRVKNAFIQMDVEGSDHCPVGIEIE